MRFLKTVLGVLGLLVMLSGWVLSNSTQYRWVEALLAADLQPTLDAWEAIRRGETVTQQHPGLAGVAEVLVTDDALLRPDGDESVRETLSSKLGSPDELRIESIREIGDWGTHQQVRPGIASYRPRVSKLEILANGKYRIEVALQDDMPKLIEKRYRDSAIFRWSEVIFVVGFLLAVAGIVVDITGRRRGRSAA